MAGRSAGTQIAQQIMEKSRLRPRCHAVCMHKVLSVGGTRTCRPRTKQGIPPCQGSSALCPLWQCRAPVSAPVSFSCLFPVSPRSVLHKQNHANVVTDRRTFHVQPRWSSCIAVHVCTDVNGPDVRSRALQHALCQPHVPTVLHSTQHT